MASRIKGITIEIDGDATGLNKALSQVDAKIRNSNAALKDINRLLKLDPTNTELLSQKQSYLSKSIEETENRLQELKKASEEAQKQLESGNLGQDKYDALQREIIATENKLKSLKDTVGSGSAKLAEFSTKATEMGSKLEEAASKTKYISAGFAGIGTAIAKTAIDFESAWADVKKTVDGTDEQFETLRQGILDLSESTASSSTDIAGVAAAAGQLGIATDDILSFTETMVMLGDSTNLSAEEAATALAKFANITGTSADNYSRLGSVIVDLGNNFATTERDIVEMAQRLAATGSLAGFSEAQILALATAMSSVGIEAEAGGSAFSKFTKKVQVAVETGSSSLEDYAKVANMTVSEFKQAFEKDAVSAMGAFISGLNDTERNGKSAIAILEDMEIKEVNMSRTLLSLSKSGDLLTRSIDTANNAWDENSALQNEAQQRYETTAAKLKQVKATLTEVAVNIGDELLPIIKDSADWLKNLTEKFTKMSPEAKKLTLSIIGIGSAASPVLKVAGKLSAVIGTVTGNMSKAEGATKGLFGVLSKNPWTLTATLALGAATAVMKIVESIDAETKAANDLIAEHEKQIDEITSQGDKAEFYISKIEELNKVEDKTAAQRQIMKTYVDQLNESVEGLNVSYDEEADMLSDTTDAIREKIKARQDEALADAFLKQSQEALEKYAESQLKVTELEARRSEAQEKLNKLIEEGRNVTEQDKATIETLTGTIEDCDSQLGDLNEAQRTYSEEATKASNAAAMQTGAFDSLLEEAGKLKEDLPNGLVEALNAGKYIIPTTVDELNALITFQEAVNKAGADGSNLVSALTSSIRSGDIDVETAIRVLTGAADDELDKLPPIVQQTMEDVKKAGKVDLEPEGRAAAEGFLSGMSSANILNGAINIMDNLMSGVRTHLKVNSPSKVWRDKVGLPIGEGIAVGLEQSSKMVEAASEDLLSTALMGAEMALPQLSPDALKNIDNNAIKVSPVNETKLDNHVTVMIGNKEFQGYIVDTASRGISNLQRNIARAGGKNV